MNMNAVPKVLAVFFVFMNILILTQSPIDKNVQEIVAKFLTLNGIVSTALGFFFFSGYFEAAENKSEAARTPQVLIACFTIACYFIAAFFIEATFVAVAVFLPSALIYAFSGHLDAIIVQSDAVGRRSGRLETRRLIYRISLVIVSITTLITLTQVDWITALTLSGRTEIILIGIIAFAAFILWIWYQPNFAITRYKVALLAGNIFWNLPRILLEQQEQYEEVLHLSFLLAIGQGTIMVANSFYGVLLSSKLKGRLIVPILVVTAVFTVLIASLTTNTFGLYTTSVTFTLAIVTYALGGLLQTVARAKYAKDWGNKSASTIYLVSIAIGFPLVGAVTIALPMATTIVAVICFIQLLRSSIYEVRSSAKRHK